MGASGVLGFSSISTGVESLSNEKSIHISSGISIS